MPVAGYAARSMTTLPTHRRRTALLVSTCLLALLSICSCDAGLSTPRVSKIELAERLAYATRSGNADGIHFEYGRIVQSVGSELRFGFAVPQAGQLVGAYTWPVAREDSEVSTLRIAVLDQDNDETVLFEETLAPTDEDSPTSLAADLSPWAGQLVNLVVGIDGPTPPSAAALQWDSLRIDGAIEELASTEAIQRSTYNVLFIVLDSLRADHLTPYGAEDISTPYLAELAAKGVVFGQTRANATWTRPSVVTMFSSQYPWRHGVIEPRSIFPDALPYLPELLSEAGYKTEGASANDMVSALFGMSRGFNNLYSLRKSPAYRGARDPHKRANFVWTHLLDELTSQPAPFFAYLHQLDPHSPYKPAKKYRRRFTQDLDGNALDASVENIQHLRLEAATLTDGQVDYLGRLYKGEVAFMDDYIGELMRQLEARDLLSNTLIVFTSDHGEEFFEHQSVGHGHTVYEELLDVPLIMRLDGVLPAGTVVTEPVDLIDLAPTLLDLLGLDTPPGMQGSSLLPYVLDTSKKREQVSFASSGAPVAYAIRYGDWKLIHNTQATVPTTPDAPDKRYELFDLRTDPGEKNNVGSSRPVVAEALRQWLAWQLDDEGQKGTPPAPRANIDAETLEALRAIGYEAQ